MTSSRVRLRRLKDRADCGLLGGNISRDQLGNKDMDYLRPNSEQKKSIISRNSRDKTVSLKPSILQEEHKDIITQINSK